MTDLQPPLVEGFFGAANHFQKLNVKHLRRRTYAACFLFTLYGALLRYTVLGVFLLLFVIGNVSICIFCFNQGRFFRSITHNRARQVMDNAVISVSVGWERSKLRAFLGSLGLRRRKIE